VDINTLDQFPPHTIIKYLHTRNLSFPLNHRNHAGKFLGCVFIVDVLLVAGLGGTGLAR
jgi:hypothetical protein